MSEVMSMMVSIKNTLDPIREQIERLKIQQNSCTQLLLDCLSVRESHPEHSERLDVVIESVEQVMAANAEALARLESQLLYNS